jgi:hypothetical protein
MSDAVTRLNAALEGRFFSWAWSQQYDFHPDGDRFLTLQYESEQSELTVVVGFLEELKERVGGGN